VLSDADGYVQALNDKFTNPSGADEGGQQAKQPSQPAGGTQAPASPPAGEAEAPERLATGS
jgi:hypothetical protein